jgi:hypothetical protein
MAFSTQLRIVLIVFDLFQMSPGSSVPKDLDARIDRN